MDNDPRQDIQHRFERLCCEAGRQGVIGFAPVEGVRLLPEQAQRLQQKLGTPSSFRPTAAACRGRLVPAGPVSRPERGGTARVLRGVRAAPGKARLSTRGDADSSAVSLGLFYHESEILAIPATWQSKKAGSDRWNEYARAYQELNSTLDYVSSSLAAEFGGVAEKATIEGWAGKVQHVGDYFAHCVSHRAFAEAAGLGWRGRHGLIVTPEAGPALRFATVFLPYSVRSEVRELAGCGDCRACLDVCPILRKAAPTDNARRTPSAAGDYREACRRRIHALGLVADVCGICVRVCWARIRSSIR